MTPQRIAAKFLVSPDPRAPVELHPFIGLFHRFIQEGRVEGLLIDVADYAHVPEGPGVVLIGHDVDYGIDLTGGEAGLLTTRKRYGDLPLAAALRDTLRKALLAVCAIEEDEAVPLRFATDALTLSFVDRLVTPNTQDTFAAVRDEIAPVVEKAFGGGGVEIARVNAEDPRKLLGARIVAREAISAAELAGRLGAS